MGIRIDHIDRTDRDRWNKYVDRAPYTNPFHRYEGLELLAEHSGTELSALIGYNGQEPIGLFPLFAGKQGRWTVARSPPMVLKSFYLGPAFLDLSGMKRRKIERYGRSFIDSCLDWAEEHLEPATLKVRVDPRFGDVRPFHWAGFDASPAYTYALDLTQDLDALLDQFSRDARSNVRNTDERDYTIETGDRDTVRRIIEQVEARHDEQDERYRLSPAFVVDLYDRLPDGQVRPYVCRVDGTVATGLVTLEAGDTIYRWQGGVTPDVDVPATDLLDWHIVQEAKARDRARYDLVGANTPRLCEYKAKFGPEVEAYFNLRRKAPLYRLSERTRTVTSGLGQRVMGAWSGLLP